MIYRFEDFELDGEQFELRQGGATVNVEPQVFDVLVFLVERSDRVVTKEELLDGVWGDRFVSESALTSRIKAARRALQDNGSAQRLIKTVHGRGYRFVGEVTIGLRVEDAAPGPTTASSSADAVPRTRYARSGDHAIAYQVAGTGATTIVFVPGFVSNVELQWELEPFASFFRRLASLGRVVVFDKRGTGLSDRFSAGDPPSLEDRMDDVRAVMDAVGCERATLVGISEGGPLSLLFSAAHPERVERLVVYGSYAHLPFGPKERADDLADLAEAAWGTGTAYASLGPSYASDRAARRAFARYEVNSATPQAAAALIRMTGEMDVRAALPSVTAPTLVLHRRGDDIVPVARGRELADAIVGARFVELTGGDHLAFSGDTDAVFEQLAAFLRAAEESAPPRTVLAALALLVLDPDHGATGHTEIDDAVARLGGMRRAGPPGLLAISFDGPARAVRAAHELLAGLGDAAQGAAVHPVEVSAQGPEVLGPGVELTAEVARLAGDGEVWTTRTVKDLVVGSGLIFEDRGAHPLAGLDEPWPLYAAS